MRKTVIVIASALVLSLNLAALPSRAETIAYALPPQAEQLVGTWDCETTKANGEHYRETDTIESIGLWLHGTARPPAQSTSREPYYDYYIGHTSPQWTYIQIDPFEIDPAKPGRSQGNYLVGTSADGLDWSIAFPAAGGHYTFAGFQDRFNITFTDLSEVCNRMTTPPPRTSPPALRLKCDSSQTGEAPSAENYVSISRVDPAWWTGEKSWWQGAGTLSRTAPDVSYEYNFFPISGQWVSVAINGSTGDYLIAKSYTSRTLDNTTWTVIYPSARPGFTFEDVFPRNAVPQNFSIVFADGYQTCCPPSLTSPCPPPQEHLPLPI